MKNQTRTADGASERIHEADGRGSDGEERCREPRGVKATPGSGGPGVAGVWGEDICCLKSSRSADRSNYLEVQPDQPFGGREVAHHGHDGVRQLNRARLASRSSHFY